MRKCWRKKQKIDRMIYPKEMRGTNTGKNREDMLVKAYHRVTTKKIIKN